jgi:hypothetical protein
MYPLMGFEDFGHIFSNVGYVISGLFFVLIVWIRSKKYEKICEQGKKLDTGDLFHPNNCSIPEQYGIFYAMGTALTFEGILSGCYHICPTAKNFQFDTTFMYAIAVLLFLKVYQFRHPDITQTAHLVFLVIGIAMVMEVIGYYTANIAFWIVFVVVYLIILSIFLLHIFTNGKQAQISWSNILKCTLLRQFVSNLCQVKYAPTCVVVIINIILAVAFLVQQKPGVSRYLLIITMSNMALYVLYYIGRKLWYRFRKNDWISAEGIRKTTMTYGILSVVCMFGAVYFFKKELKSSAVSPAESRDLNEDCAVGMFDNHDMWHFLSAAGLFYVFMFILTLEDANTGVPRNRIPVF